jgi:hypothetical protein
MKNMDNMVDNIEKDFYFMLAHATSMSQEELEVSSIDFKDFGI